MVLRPDLKKDSTERKRYTGSMHKPLPRLKRKWSRFGRYLGRASLHQSRPAVSHWGHNCLWRLILSCVEGVHILRCTHCNITHTVTLHTLFHRTCQRQLVSRHGAQFLFKLQCQVDDLKWTNGSRLQCADEKRNTHTQHTHTHIQALESTLCQAQKGHPLSQHHSISATTLLLLLLYTPCTTSLHEMVCSRARGTGSEGRGRAGNCTGRVLLLLRLLLLLVLLLLVLLLLMRGSAGNRTGRVLLLLLLRLLLMLVLLLLIKRCWGHILLLLLLLLLLLK